MKNKIILGLMLFSLVLVSFTSGIDPPPLCDPPVCTSFSGCSVGDICERGCCVSPTIEDPGHSCSKVYTESCGPIVAQDGGSANAAILGVNDYSSSTAKGIWGNSISGIGVYGSGIEGVYGGGNIGVRGSTAVEWGRGVSGQSSNANGGYGVYGTCSGTGCYGVFGTCSGTGCYGFYTQSNAYVGKELIIGKYNSKPACSSNNKGSFVFDNIEDKPYICASSGWKPLDSDGDKDGFVDSSGTILSGPNQGKSYDCDDLDASIDIADDGTCDGDNDNHIDKSAGGDDCNDNDKLASTLTTCYIDEDDDEYGIGEDQGCCDGIILPLGYVANNDDCWDTNNLVNPDQTNYIYGNINNGDYNCNNLTERQYIDTGAGLQMYRSDNCYETSGDCTHKFMVLEANVPCGTTTQNTLCEYGGSTCIPNAGSVVSIRTSCR